MPKNRWLATAAVLLLTSGVARAAPPKTITYSGFLLDSAGVPVGGSSTFTFTLWDAPSGGNELYREVQSGILPSAADGYFSVTIGLGTLIPDLRFANQTYLEVQWGTELPMSPRIAISSVPSAFSALTVDWSGIQGKPVSSCSGATPYVTGIDANGAVTCAAAPSGAGGCSSGQLLEWNGSSWACAADDDTTYTAAAPITLNGTQFSIAAANATTAGYLSSGDWNTFNSKLGSVAVSAPLAGNGTGGSPLAIPAASATQNGYLSSSNWSTFNGKLSSVAANAPLTGAGTTASPLSIASGGVTFSHLAQNGCTPNQIPKWNGSAWACANDAAGSGTVTSVSAANGTPITVATGTTTPVLSMSPASSTADGYLLAGDWKNFNDKLSAVAVDDASLVGDGTVTAPLGVALGGIAFKNWASNGCTPGQLPKWNNLLGWTCADDIDTNSGGDITGVTAGTGLTGGGTNGTVTVSATYGGSAGDFGTASTLARSDHLHGATYYSKAELNDATGTINAATNPVDWSRLKNVPAGFADGVDADSGGDIQGVTAGTGLTGGGTNGTVTVSATYGGSAGDFGTASTLARSDHLHNGTYYTETELNAAGTINLATNPVSWTKLKGVPPGFADGNDADSGGTITNVTAGTGLTGGGSSGSVTLSLSSSPSLTNLTLSGTLYAGWERISTGTTCGTGQAYGVCENYNGLGCYTASASATCSTGKRLLGGGCYTNNTYRSNIRENAPATDTTWRCSANCQTDTTVVTAWAICARIY